MRFGCAGVPVKSADRTTLGGIACAGELGLDAFEMEFVHGCRMKEETAGQAGEIARKHSISLSCHGSYYLNLLSPEPEKLERTKQELLTTGAILTAAGGGRIAFHSGFYLGMPKEEAFKKMRAVFQELTQEFKDRKYTAILAPELTGKPTQFGSLDELWQLVEEIGYDKLRPTIDWSHYHARDNGFVKGKEEYVKALGLVEKKGGKKALKSLHCHFQSVKFSIKGELSHLPLSADTPPFRPLAEALKEFECDGTIISESPLIEADALEMKSIYASI